MGDVDLALAVLWYAAFVVSTTAHEAAHALAAWVGGDPTAYRAGQVSLNPLPHMRREPFGMVVIPVLSALSQGWCIGWASTPYNPAWELRHPRRAAWMAAAGPAANLAIALAALIALRVGLETGLFFAPDRVGFSRLVGAEGALAAGVGTFLSILLVLNVILALFNLIPIPPLDGATAVTLFMPEDLALRFREVLRTSRIGFIGLLAAWYLFGSVVWRVFGALLALVHPDVPYG